MTKFEWSRVDWMHVLVVSFLVGTALWYLSDVMSASMRVENLMLVAPVTGLIVVLWIINLVSAVRGDETGAPVAAEGSMRERIRAYDWRGIQVLLLAGLYVLTLERVGFDLASFLFLFLSLLVLKERRVIRAALVSLVLAVVMSVGLQRVLTYPVPLFVDRFQG